MSAIALVYLYRNIDSQLKVFVQNKLSQQFPELTTELDSAQLVPSKGIILRGISISKTDKFGKVEPLIFVQEAFVACDVEIKTILSGKADPSTLVLRKLTAYLTINEHGEIVGLRELKPRNSSFETACPIEICESEIIFRDLRKPEAEPLLFSGLIFSLTPPVEPDETWGIAGKTTNTKTGDAECQGTFSPKNGNFSVTGFAKKLNVDHQYFSYLPTLTVRDTSLDSFQAKVDLQFELERDTNKHGHLPLATQFRVHGKLYDGKVLFPLIVKHPISDVSLDFDVTHDSLHVQNMSATSGESRLQLEWRQSGLFEIRQANLGYQVDDFRFDKRFLPSLASWLPERLNDQLDHFETEGQASLHGKIHYNGQRWGVESAVFQLANLAVTCDKFPYMLDYLQGTIAISPFEMQSRNGSIFLSEGMALNLESTDRKTAIRGNMYQIMTESPFGKFEITAENVPINDKLRHAIHAMSPEQQEIIQSFNADGQFDAKLEISLPGSICSDDGQRDPDLLLHVVPQNCSIRYEKFQLPLRNVCGVIKMQNGHWSFNSLRAENGASVIMGNGHLIPDGRGNVEFQLRLSSDGLKLNDDLIAAFQSESHRDLLTSLNFSGRANVDLLIRYLSESRDFHLAFDAKTDPNVTTIKPTVFPLPFDTISCHVQFNDGKVIVNDFRGRKGDAFLSTDLQCMIRDDGSWVISLDNMLAERFEHDTELIRALPAELRTFVDGLQLKEPITVRGSLCFQRDGTLESALRSYWNLGVICHQNSANVGVPLTNICGKVNLLGKNDDRGNTVFGQLELDSVNYGDYQLTDIRGPFSFYENKIVLGRGARLPGFARAPNNGNGVQSASNSPNPGTASAYQQTAMSVSAELPNAANASYAAIAPAFAQPATTPIVNMPPMASMTPSTGSAFVPVSLPGRDAMTALSDLPWLLSLHILPENQVETTPVMIGAYGGNIQFDGHVFLQKGFLYRIDTNLYEIDLGKATRETLAEHPFKGKLSGGVKLEGGKESMTGSGSLSLREADIYKLPTMQRIMQFVGVRNSNNDQSAICSSDVEFSLHGSQVTLSDVTLEGNLLTLGGTGEVDMEAMTINLDLGTQIAGNRSQLPIVSSVINETSKQITEIHVGGSLKDGDLSVRTQAFPGVMRALQSQQENQQNGKRPIRDFFKSTLNFGSGS